MKEIAIIPSFEFNVFERPRISFNYAEVAAALDAELARYQNILVTEETLAADKKLMQSLRAEAKRVDTLRIDAEKKLKEPIVAMGSQFKEISGKFLAVADLIAAQVKTFETARLEEICGILRDALNVMYERAGLRDEYQDVTINDLIMLTSVTASGSLSAKARDAISLRVQERLAAQTRTDLRLSQLEAACYKAGLSVPLTPAHVQNLIALDDDSYQTALTALMHSELERAELIKQKHAADIAEAEARAEVEARAQYEADASRAEIAAREAAAREPVITESGKKIIQVTAVFLVEVGLDVAEETVQTAFLRKLESEYTTIKTVTAERV